MSVGVDLPWEFPIRARALFGGQNDQKRIELGELRDRELEDHLADLDARIGETDVKGLIILGRVPTESDLPAAPNRPGDGYITDDPLDHLWVWVDDPLDPPARWVDTGPISSTDHDALTGVSPDDHHDQLHAHNGVDGSGVIAHSNTSGKGTDDHHAQLHSLESHTNVLGLSAKDKESLMWDEALSAWVSEYIPEGPAGERGERIYVAEGPPDGLNTPGSFAGDQYIDTLNGNLYSLI